MGIDFPSAPNIDSRPDSGPSPYFETLSSLEGDSQNGEAKDGRSERQRYRAYHYLLMIVAWGLSFGAAGLLVLRWRPVSDVLTIALVALTPFLLVPLLIALAAAWFSRNAFTRVGVAAVAFAYLITAAPFDGVIGCGPSEATDAIEIMTANVQAGGGQADLVAANIVANDPDIVVLQEVKYEFLVQLRDDPTLADWQFRADADANSTKTEVIWSKWPITDIEFGTLGLRSSVVGTVDTPHGRLDIGSVHTIAPSRPSRVDEWKAQFWGLQTLPTDTPSVMAGDFNATEDHQPFRQLLSQGWTDVHDDKGCGIDNTWPVEDLPFPVMRLDHILVTDHFEVLSTELGDAGGSDHLAVISRIRFRTPAG